MSRDRYLSFLQTELNISEAELAIAVDRARASTDPLHMILWQYGLVTLEQLDRTFDWLTEQSQLATQALLETL